MPAEHLASRISVEPDLARQTHKVIDAEDAAGCSIVGSVVVLAIGPSWNARCTISTSLAMPPLRERTLQAALADAAPGTDDIGLNVDLYTWRLGDSNP